MLLNEKLICLVKLVLAENTLLTLEKYTEILLHIHHIHNYSYSLKKPARVN